VASLVTDLPKIAELKIGNGKPSKTVKWGKAIKPGDILAVRYGGGRAYVHVGALWKDKDPKGILNGNDLVINAGPHPLLTEALDEGSFDGQVHILRPKLNR
jgi:hypothetical protein